MRHRDRADVLADCLGDVASGRRTVADCLDEHPEDRAELAPLLEIAQRLGPAPELDPDPTRRLAARHRFVEALAVERRLPWWRRILARSPFPASPRSAQRFGRLNAMPAAIVAAAVLTLGIGGGSVLAAQDAQPGDALYGLKTAVEQARVAAALSEDGRAEAQLSIAERRLDEAERAQASGDADAVAETTASYERAMAQAEKHLAKAAAGGGTANALAHLKANQERHLALRGGSDGTTDDPTKDAPGREKDRGKTGLANAIERVNGRDTSARDALDTDAAGPADADAPQDEDAAKNRGGNGNARAIATPTTEEKAVTGQIEALATAVTAKSTDIGGSNNGLLAKLNAARAAIQRGQPETARNQLAALSQQLDAELQSGRLSQSDHAALVAAYNALLGDLNKLSPPAEREKGNGASKGQTNPGNGKGSATPADATGKGHDK